MKKTILAIFLIIIFFSCSKKEKIIKGTEISISYHKNIKKFPKNSFIIIDSIKFTHDSLLKNLSNPRKLPTNKIIFDKIGNKKFITKRNHIYLTTSLAEKLIKTNKQYQDV